MLSTAGKKNEALLVFQFNTYYHPSTWYGYKSYGELLVELENYPQAIEAYEKLISLNPENEEAKAELDRLNKLVPEEKEEEKSAGGNK